MDFIPVREGQLTEKQISWSYWWLENKLKFRAVLAVFLGIFGAVTLAYGAYGFADWFFGSGVRERAEIARMAITPTGYPEIQRRMAPQPPFFESPIVLLSGSGSYDIHSAVTNPNADWRLEISWTFAVDGMPVGASRRATVLPKGTSLLTHLGYRAEVRPAGAELKIEAMSWKRIDKHAIKPTYEAWAGERLDFRVSDIRFVPPPAGDSLSLTRVSFRALNNTGYGYRQVGFHVILYEGSRISGVNYVTVSEFRAGESRTVDASWFTPIAANRVEVIPEAEIFDGANYLPVIRR